MTMVIKLKNMLGDYAQREYHRHLRLIFIKLQLNLLYYMLQIVELQVNLSKIVECGVNIFILIDV